MKRIERTQVIFYTINCQACEVLKTKLDQKNVDYTTVTDLDEISAVAIDNNIDNAPMLQVGEIVYDYNDAVDWVNSL